MTTNDYQWLPKTIKYYQRHSKTIKDYRKDYQKTIEKTIKKTIKNTIEKTIKKTIENTIEKTIKKTIEKTIKKTIEKTIKKTITKTIEKTVEKTIKKTIKKTIEKTILKMLSCSNQNEKYWNIAQSFFLQNLQTGKEQCVSNMSFSKTTTLLRGIHKVQPSFCITAHQRKLNKKKSRKNIYSRGLDLKKEFVAKL